MCCSVVTNQEASTVVKPSPFHPTELQLIPLFNIMQSVCIVNYFVNKGNVYIVKGEFLLQNVYDLYLQITFFRFLKKKQQM